MSKEYNSKSTINKYTPEEIQEFLNSGESKLSIIERLGWYMEAFNKYIKEHNLTYNPSKRRGHTKKQVKKHKEKEIRTLDYNKTEDPLKKFYEMLAKKKEKRTLRELKNPYDW
jgi:hypothetical protein